MTDTTSVSLISTGDAGGETARPSLLTPRGAIAFALLAVLVVVFDILFWVHEPGINLFIFFVTLNAAVIVAHRDRLGEIRSLLLAALALVAALPLVEAGTPWGFLTAAGGTALLALGLSRQLSAFETWSSDFLRFGIVAPFRLAIDAVAAVAEGAQRRLGGTLLRRIAVWFVPLAVTTVFAMLLVAANPVIELGLKAVQLDQFLGLLQPERVFLWCCAAAFAWPFLMPRPLRLMPRLEAHGPVRPAAESLLFGEAAIRNSLILFNALFAVQTIMDLLFLWGGVRLPDGLSYAEYAHRGAYPLIVTALLAAAFVLAAMRRDGPGVRSPLIRALVYAWIAQNIWLVVSSLLRLDLYVEEYGLSELRFAAAVWMGLVAIGLVLIVARIALGRSNRWLVSSNLVALALTFWSLAWFDMSGFIARYNVDHSRELTGAGQAVDLGYIRRLGPDAVPALDVLLARGGLTGERLAEAAAVRAELAAEPRSIYTEGGDLDWREWSWRAERLQRYLAQPFPAVPTDAIQ